MLTIYNPDHPADYRALRRAIARDIDIAIAPRDWDGYRHALHSARDWASDLACHQWTGIASLETTEATYRVTDDGRIERRTLNWHTVTA